MTDPMKTWLRPLDDGDPSIDLLDRAHRGPSQAFDGIDPSSPLRPRLGAAAVAVIVFVVAVTFAWRAFSPSDRAPATNGTGVFIAVDPTSPDFYMDALIRAPVVVRDGCVLIGDGTSLTLPIWPKGYTADRDAEGHLVIKDAEGSVVAVEGADIAMGGGYVAEFQPADKVAPKADQVAQVESGLGYPIPDACLTGIYGIWQVGQIVSPSGGGMFLAPHLSGGQGWYSVSSDPVPASGHNGTTAWASTIPIAQDDVQLGAAIPPSTIQGLPRDGIVVTVEVVPAAFKDDSVPFPYADLSFDLATATQRGPEAEEPTGDYSVLQSENADAATLVRVYFGSPDPSPELVTRAQSALDTLQLPPTCTMGDPGSYAVSLSSTTASSGDVLTLTGTVPLQREDGSFDESGSGRMVAWWNADPKDWPYLSSGSPSPSPAVEGQGILELGQAPMDTCTFAISFTVPEAAPGAYPIVVIQESGGGAALTGSATVFVTQK